jgi:hypothetical protein
MPRKKKPPSPEEKFPIFKEAFSKKDVSDIASNIGFPNSEFAYLEMNRAAEYYKTAQWARDNYRNLSTQKSLMNLLSNALKRKRFEDIYDLITRLGGIEHGLLLMAHENLGLGPIGGLLERIISELDVHTKNADQSVQASKDLGILEELVTYVLSKIPKDIGGAPKVNILDSCIFILAEIFKRSVGRKAGTSQYTNGKIRGEFVSFVESFLQRVDPERARKSSFSDVALGKEVQKALRTLNENEKKFHELSKKEYLEYRRSEYEKKRHFLDSR